MHGYRRFLPNINCHRHRIIGMLLLYQTLLCMDHHVESLGASCRIVRALCCFVRAGVVVDSQSVLLDIPSSVTLLANDCHAF